MATSDFQKLKKEEYKMPKDFTEVKKTVHLYGDLKGRVEEVTIPNKEEEVIEIVESIPEIIEDEIIKEEPIEEVVEEPIEEVVEEKEEEEEN